MSQKNKKYKIFANGSNWLKADFHLHTKADKEFKYTDEANNFIKNYIAKLKAQDIHTGVITNHNKFAKDEFVNLAKQAIKAEILLLPGVELSVNDGANGIHVLVVFSTQWLEKGNDYINPFISSMFTGKAENEYQHENGRSDKNILQVVEELEKTSRDYFLVFAHVEQRSGLWQEMSGGKLGDFSHKRYAKVRQRTLGFQKVRTHDQRDKVQNWLQGWYPAEVEGSDCKSIDGIAGKNRETWLKIGELTFEAVKYALTDHQNRIRAELPEPYQHSYIKSIAFEGGILDGQRIDFSPELNSLIGIRGSGKSSVLEAVRYLLNIPFGIKTTDTDYKNNLVVHALGSGGRATIEAVDRYGQQYRLSRILGEAPEVFIDNELTPGIAIRETVIRKPVYFGQKDLSSTGEGFEQDLVEKLVGEQLGHIRRQIDAQKHLVIQQCERLIKLTDIDERIQEQVEKQQDAAFRLKIFKDYGIDDKLQKQKNFKSDEKKISDVLRDIDSYENALTETVNQYEDELKNHLAYRSKQNGAFFASFFALFETELNSFDSIKTELEKIRLQLERLQQKAAEFGGLKQAQTDEFAEIRRTVEADLKLQDKQLNLDEHFTLQNAQETAKRLLDSLHKERDKSTTIKNQLVQALSALNDLWHQEFILIDTELKKINANHTALQIDSDYKGNKAAFLAFFKTLFKGSRVRENTLQRIVDEYADFAAVFNDLEQVKLQLTSLTDTFEQYFFEHLKELLTWRVPDKFVIKYHGKALQHHSLGQRASALILFVLSQKENDLVIIDQPEDDLDNQTIYQDVIKLVRQLKPQTQFIFATHNANFPVLGDSEQIHACRYADNTMQISSGSVDSPVIQQEIVDIMEGGEDAFNKRKEIYQIWKTQNC